MSAPAFSHRAGDRIADKYLLLRLLEIGGMGAVWVAHHLALDVHVAIKFILADVTAPYAEERLLREAQVAARVRHPAIVQILDVGHTAEGEPFLAMELLDGELFAEVLHRERRLDPATAIRVILPIAEALDTIHRHGSIHRDVKPENIFLTRNDADRWQPKLLDFGLARSMDPRVARLTEVGAVMGTPEYMSFERLTGEDVDHGEDVYALSVVVYQAITGERPFWGKTPMEVIRAVAENHPRSTVDHGAGDAELWDIVKRGLAPRDERWASAWDLGRALAGWAWRNGSHDDIVGMSLRPVWIDDEPRRSSVRPRSTPPAAHFDEPTPVRQALLPTIPCERHPTPAETHLRTEDLTTDEAPPVRPRKRWLAPLATALALLAIAGLSSGSAPEARPESASAAFEGFEAVPSLERMWLAPEHGGEATPVVAHPPEASPPASAAPVSPPPVAPARRRETQLRAAPLPASAARIVEPLLKNPYN